MKIVRTMCGISKQLGILIILFVSNMSLFALKPGDTIPSQKMSYIDPVLGKKCARLTTMGVANHTAIFSGQCSSAETCQWSADSKSVILWFGFGSYPKGIYTMNVESGLIRYLAPLGNSPLYYNHAAYNPLDPEEVIYEYNWKGSPSFVEIRGVKTVAPYTVRTIRRFDGIFKSGSKLSMSHDGKYCYIMVYSPKGNAYGVVVNMLTRQDHPDFPYRGPKWNFHDNSLQDGCLWNPVNNKAILFLVPDGSTTNRKRVCYDFNTGKYILHNSSTSHHTWSADGKVAISNYGIIDEFNKCLAPDKITGPNANYKVPPLPYYDPSEKALGLDGHIIGGFVDGLNWDSKNVKPRYLRSVTVRELITYPWKDILNRKQNLLGLSWGGDFSEVIACPHTQVSPDGRYLVWNTSVKNRVGGSDTIPPGPKNTSGNGGYVDIFLMELKSGGKSSVPIAPTNLSASMVSSTQIDLSWADNSDDETQFKIERKTGSTGTYAQIATVGSNISIYHNAGLTESKRYYYRVRASNAAGDSAYSNEANAKTMLAIPIAPSALSAKAVSSSRFELTWTDNADNETGFKIERKKWTGGTFAQIATVGANAKSYSDTGLAPNANYYYRTRAYNASGDSDYSNTSGGKTLSEIVKPAITSPATASMKVNGSLTFQITASNNPTSFDATGLPGGISLDSSTGLISGSVNTVGVYNLTVSAINNGGIGTASLTLTVQPDSMAAPSNLVAIVTGATVNLTWSDNCSDETYYKVYRKVGASMDWLYFATLKPDATSFSDTEVVVGQQYTYWVSAKRINDGGKNPPSYSDGAEVSVNMQVVSK